MPTQCTCVLNGDHLRDCVLPRRYHRAAAAAAAKKKSGGGGGPVWLHPKMDKATADGLIGEGDDATGHFLVRTVNKAEGRYAQQTTHTHT